MTVPLTSEVCKLLKLLTRTQMGEYLRRRNRLSGRQRGFRGRRSYITDLPDLYDRAIISPEGRNE